MGTSSCALAMTGMPLCSHYMGSYNSNRTHGASNSNAYYNCNVSHKLFKVIAEINHHFLVQRNDSIKVMHQSGLNSPESCLFCLAKLHVPLHHLQHVLRLIIRQTREIQFTAHPRLTKYLPCPSCWLRTPMEGQERCLEKGLAPSMALES